MEHHDHPDEGYAKYMMTQASYVFYSTTLWKDMNHIGNYFIVPTTAITATYQKYTER